MEKQFLVIGLGRFGESVARELARQGAEVMVVDEDEELINHSLEYATQAVIMDATDEQALDTLGVESFDVVVVCVGEIEPSIVITMLCKERGVKKVIAKASSHLHADILRKVGADRSIFPERDGGLHLARALVSSSLIDLVELATDYGIAEFTVHSSWENKTLHELNFRKHYDVNVVAIKSPTKPMNVSPGAEDVLHAGDLLVVIGHMEHINKLEQLMAEQ